MPAGFLTSPDLMEPLFAFLFSGWDRFLFTLRSSAFRQQVLAESLPDRQSSLIPGVQPGIGRAPTSCRRPTIGGPPRAPIGESSRPSNSILEAVVVHQSARASTRWRKGGSLVEQRHKPHAMPTTKFE